MNISYKNKKLEKLFTDKRQLIQKNGAKRAFKIDKRLAEFEAAQTLFDFWPPMSGPSRCHELTEGKHGQNGEMSVDLDHPYRLIFKPAHYPAPAKADGGLDWAMVTDIIILGVEDTHG